MSKPQVFDFTVSIQERIAAFERAANAKNAAGMAAFYAEDATLLPPGSPMIKGRSNIHAFWQAFLSAGAANPEIRTVSIESSGDLACEVGTYDAIVPAPGGGTMPSSGKYVVVWKRQADGSILMIADSFSPNV